MYANRINNMCGGSGRRLGMHWQSNKHGTPIPVTTYINTDIFMSATYWGELLAANVNQLWIDNVSSGSWQVQTHQDQDLYFENGYLCFRRNYSNDRYIIWRIYPVDNPRDAGDGYYAEVHTIHGTFSSGEFPVQAKFYRALFGRSLSSVYTCITTPVTGCPVQVSKNPWTGQIETYGGAFGGLDRFLNPVESTDYYQLYWVDLRNQDPTDRQYEFHNAPLIRPNFVSIRTCHYDTENYEFITNTGVRSYVIADRVNVYPCDGYAISPFGTDPQTLEFEKIAIPVEYTITI